MATSKYIRTERKGRVALLSFNRPPANAYNIEFMQTFFQAVKKVDSDPDVVAVIIRSDSEKFFCAGADVKEFQSNDTAANQRMVECARAATTAMEGSDKIFIAQLAGHALGGGLEIAMSCDLRFGSRGDYRLGLTEVRLGLIPGNGGTQRLTRLIGVSRALELLATGDAFSAEEAAKWGLINRLYEREALEAATYDFAWVLGTGPALALAATKKAVRLGADMPLSDALALEKQLCDPLYHTQDASEGLRAFLEKRSPSFAGK